MISACTTRDQLTICHGPGTKQPARSATALSIRAALCLAPHPELVSTDKPDALHKMHSRTATAFLYVFLTLCSPNEPGFKHNLRSNIPVGARLGSSASFFVYMSTALNHQVGNLEAESREEQLE